MLFALVFAMSPTHWFATCHLPYPGGTYPYVPTVIVLSLGDMGEASFTRWALWNLV